MVNALHRPFTIKHLQLTILIIWIQQQQQI